MFQRIRRGARSYAPLGIPSDYEVVTEDGEILKFGQHQYETLQHARARACAQVRVWNLVWWRKVSAYILAATWLLALSLPILLVTRPDADEPTGLWRHVGTVVRIADAFIPYGALDHWINFYASHPVSITLIVAVLVIFHYLGRRLKVAIVDEVQSTWSQVRLPQSQLRWHDLVLHRFRHHPFTARILSIAQATSTNFFAVVFLGCGMLVSLSIINGVLFKLQDVGGMVCQEGGVTTEREPTRPYRRRKLFERYWPDWLAVGETKLIGRARAREPEPKTESLPVFDVSEVCHSTGVWLIAMNLTRSALKRQIPLGTARSMRPRDFTPLAAS